jgi:hypothetical protein
MFGLIPNKVEMAEEKEIKEWQKYRRQSIQALPWTVAFSLVLALVFFLVNLVVPIPFWLIVLVFGIQGFVIVGDVVNIIYLGHKLRRAGREPNSA